MKQKSTDELYEIFRPVAEAEAARLMRYLTIRLYEADDLVDWAYLDGSWTRYVDNPGAMRVIIRFSMLRSLAKDHSLADTLRNLPYWVVEELSRSLRQENPVNQAAYQEVKEILSELTLEQREFILRRFWLDEPVVKIARSTGVDRHRVTRELRKARLFMERRLS